MPEPDLAFHARAFARFLQADVAPHERADQGLQRIFRAAFPVRSRDETASLEFVAYALERPRYDEDDCRRRGLTLAAPLKVTIRLVVWDDDGGVRSIRDIKEQEVYFGEVPLLTARGTFLVHGVERAPVFRLARAPGARHVTAPDGAPGVEVVPRHGPPLLLWLDRRGGWQATWGERDVVPGERLFRAYGFDPDTLGPCDPAHDEAEVCRALSPDDATDEDHARAWFGRTFYEAQGFDLGIVGRLALDHVLALDTPHDQTALDARDLLALARVLRAEALLDAAALPAYHLRDLADHCEDHARQGILEVIAKARERMDRTREVDRLMPHDLVYAKWLAKAWLAMLERSPWIEDLDATNPLSVVAQSWRVRADRDAAEGLTQGPLARWLTPEPDDPGVAQLAPGAPVVVDYGTIDRDAEGDTRSLAARLGLSELARRAAPLAAPEGTAERTALEAAVAARAGALLVAPAPGRVAVVNERRLWLVPDADGAAPVAYRLRPDAARLATPLDLRALVGEGDVVAAGDVLAEGAAVADGGLALGRRCAAAFAPDLAPGRCRVSSKVREAFRSVRLTRVEAALRDTWNGVERFEREVPGVDAHALRHLDAEGLAALGAEVEPGDVLAGRVTPRERPELTPEEKLLFAIQGVPEGPADDTAVRATTRGRVVGLEVFVRRGRERSERHEAIVEAMKRDLDDEAEELATCLAAQQGLPREAVVGEARDRVVERRWALDRGDDLPPGVVSVAVFDVLEFRDLEVGDEIADARGERWTVEAVTDDGADVALPVAQDRARYLMKLAPAPPPAKKPAKARDGATRAPRRRR